jgi:hypothetical protein
MRLGPDANGLTQGMTRSHKAAQIPLPLLAPIALMLMARGVLRGWPVCLGPIAMRIPVSVPKEWLCFTAVSVGYFSFLSALWLAILIIPSTVCPCSLRKLCIAVRATSVHRALCQFQGSNRLHVHYYVAKVYVHCCVHALRGMKCEIGHV